MQMQGVQAPRKRVILAKEWGLLILVKEGGLRQGLR